MQACYGKFCQKTHLDADTYRKGLANRIARLRRSFPKPPPQKEAYDEGQGLRRLKRALEQACARKWNEALFDFQWQWIVAEKRKYFGLKDPAKKRKAQAAE